jgi:hypothetical protein
MFKATLGTKATLDVDPINFVFIICCSNYIFKIIHFTFDRNYFFLAQYQLTKQQNDFKIQLKNLEDDLLSRLSSAGGNFLGDTALVENLEHTKATAKEIQEKVTDI